MTNETFALKGTSQDSHHHFFLGLWNNKQSAPIALDRCEKQEHEPEYNFTILVIHNYLYP